MILHLLQHVGYPDIDNVRDDFELGFDMIGDVCRAQDGGWRDRDDSTPSP